jgi:hypothetical protein
LNILARSEKISANGSVHRFGFEHTGTLAQNQCGCGVFDSDNMTEGRMRRFLIALAITLLPSFAIAAHGGGGHGGGGHMGGGWGGHMGGGSGGHSMAMAGGHMGSWHGGNWHHAASHQGRFVHRHNRFFFVHRHNRFFFVGAPFFAAYGYGYDCWRWVPTAWGPRRIWVCGDYY